MMWSYLPRKETSRPEDPEEIELAYLLQNMADKDPSVLKRLISHYSKIIFQWVEVLIYYQRKAIPSREQVMEVLQSTYRYAFEHADQFHGHQNITDWLLTIGFRETFGWRGISIGNHRSSTTGELGHGGTLSRRSIPVELNWLEQLQLEHRNALILRYLFDLKLADISLICDCSEKDIHQWLMHERNKFLYYPLQSHIDHELQAYVDGLLDEKPDELEKVNKHLASCDTCQQAYQNLEEVDKSFSRQLKAAWNSTDLNSEEMDQLFQFAGEEPERTSAWWKQILSFRQVAWALGLAVMLVGVTVISARLIPVDTHLTQKLPTVAPQQPPVVAIETSAKPARVLPSQAPLYIAPAFAKDGKWGVFTASTYSDNSHGIMDRTVYLYNRSTGTMQVINYSSDVDKTWVWWDLSPSISADGHWIVYVSSTNDPTISGEACATPDQRDCLDIVLYDRETGMAKRLSQGFNGGRANGDSLAPTISEDGKWVAFWSTADNIIADAGQSCQSYDYPMACLNIYLYNLENGAIELIPIQTIPGDSVYGVDRLSLSSDGRYVGFTRSMSTQVSAPSGTGSRQFRHQGNPFNNFFITPQVPQIVHSSEAIIYDRITGSYELENQAQDGTAGNGESSSPILSGDGRYVAFVSSSTNLIPGGTVRYSEIYVRDRISGQIELISTSSDGNHSNDDNGLTFMERGFYSLDMSSDGRYVAFESTAANLGTSVNAGCTPSTSSDCVYLYVHDRQNSTTDMVSALPSQDFTLFPGVSSDGRWIGFMEYFHDCSPTQLRCSNVMLYDRQTGWTSNLTRFGQQAPKLPWVYEGNLSLPWQMWESTSLALSQDGKLIAMGGNDGTIRMWNSQQISSPSSQKSPTKIFNINANDYFSSLTFNSDGEWLAAGTTSGMVYVWNTGDEKLIFQLKDLADPIKSLAFSPDDTYLVISTSKNPFIWKLADNQLAEVDGFFYGSPDAYSVAISPQGTMIASAHRDGSIWLQNLPDGQLVERLGTGDQTVNYMVFSQDGSEIASRLSDGTIYIWKMGKNASQAISVTLVTHFQTYGTTGQLVFSPDHEYLAVAGTVGEVPVWSTSDGTLRNIASSIPNEMVYSIAFTNDGSRLAVAFVTQIASWAIPEQQATSYFVNATSNHFVDTKPFSNSTVNDIPMDQSQLRNMNGIYFDLEHTANVASFPLLVPVRLPDDFTFVSGILNKDGSVWLRYVATNDQGNQASLFVFEQPRLEGIAPVMVIGQDANIIRTQLQTSSGVVSSEYVNGDWLWRQSFTQPSDGSTSGVSHSMWFWDADSTAAHLRWEQDGILIGLYYQPHVPYTPLVGNGLRYPVFSSTNLILGENDLEQIATGMTLYQSSSTGAESIPIYRDGSGQ